MDNKSTLETENDLASLSEIEFLKLLARRTVYNEVQLAGERVLCIYADPPFNKYLPDFKAYLEAEIASLHNGRSRTPVLIGAKDYEGLLFDMGFYLQSRTFPREPRLAYSPNQISLEEALERARDVHRRIIEAPPYIPRH